MIGKILRATLPLCILGGCIYGAMWLVWNPPQPQTMEVKPTLIQVKGTILKKAEFPVMVRSQGMAQPRTRSTLLPEVTAKVVSLAPNFDEGGFFKKDDILIKLDSVDYETALVVAKSAEAQARTTLAEEQAKADQALEDWKALGRTSPASDLTLRKPQLAQARAALEAKTAEVTRAQRDVDRTTIRAPYDGQVLEQSVDVGQLVSPGTALGKIFAVDFFEVRLPLPERDLRFLALPERFVDAKDTEIPAAKVYLRANVAGRQVRWEGQITRVESAIDDSTRQLVAVAKIPEPYAKKGDGVSPLKIGQFVEADIAGETLKDVFIIPRSVVRAGNEIILITAQNTLHRVSIEPLTGDEKQVVISANQAKGPREGDRLCITPIPFPAEGAKVDPVIEGEEKNATPSVVGQKAGTKKEQASVVP